MAELIRLLDTNSWCNHCANGPRISFGHTQEVCEWLIMAIRGEDPPAWLAGPEWNISTSVVCVSFQKKPEEGVVY